MPGEISERGVILLVASVQFVNILDFMMVMPLGPDFAWALGIPVSRLGLIGGSYTAAAALAGAVGSLFLDRFDRRSALGVAMLGLSLGTAAGGLGNSLGSLVAARVLAGTFGGPATSLSISIVADTVPPARRGRALGAVMGAFSAASVLGVPAGLELSRLGGWRAPFFAVAALAVVVTAVALRRMPPMRRHLAAPAPGPGARRPFLADPAAVLSLAGTATVMTAVFCVAPNLAAFLQLNAGWPRERLGILYMMGGALSFLVLRAVGRLVDRVGSAPVAAAGTAVMVANLFLAFGKDRPLVPAWALFLAFMMGNSLRNPAQSALATRVPPPEARARFQSAQSAVQHLAASAGAFLSARLLDVAPDGRLAGMGRVALLSGGLALLLPGLLLAVERRVRARESVAQVPGAAAVEAPPLQS